MNHLPAARSLAFVLCAVVVASCASSKGPSFTESSQRHNRQLIGAWRVVQLAVRTPGGEWDIRPDPQGGLYVFSARHYSYIYVPGGRPRPHFGNPGNPSESEKAAAYDTFIAGGGSYTFDGAVLELRADLRKNPNEMTGEIWRWEVGLFRQDTVQFIFRNPPFLRGRDWRTTLVRAD